MPLSSAYSVLLPVEKVPPTELASPARSKRTRTFFTGTFPAVRKSARISERLLATAPATLTPTTLGLAETDAELMMAVTGPTLEEPCTLTVCVSVMPPMLVAIG